MSEIDSLIQSSRSKEFQLKLSDDELQLNKKFKERFENLCKDIDHIDFRMKHINNFITNLETQVNNLRALIANDENPSKKASYYTLMNTCVELNARYEDLYLKCIDIKFKYRKEQDDLDWRIKRMIHLELPKLKTDDAGNEELSSTKLSKLLNIILDKLNSTDNKTGAVFDSIAELEQDKEYKI